MANLVVGNIDEDVVSALKERAGRFGRSAEAEHRLILTEDKENTDAFKACGVRLYNPFTVS